MGWGTAAAAALARTPQRAAGSRFPLLARPITLRQRFLRKKGTRMMCVGPWRRARCAVALSAYAGRLVVAGRHSLRVPHWVPAVLRSRSGHNVQAGAQAAPPAHTQTHTLKHTRKHTHANTHANTHTHNAQTHTHKHTYTHSYIHTSHHMPPPPTHTHIHTHTHNAQTRARHAGWMALA